MGTSTHAPVQELELLLEELPMGRLLAAPRRDGVEHFAVMLEPDFIRQNFDIAPICYPYLDAFRKGLVEFHEGTTPTSPFPGGLPGFIADSLPDKWGAIVASHEDPERAASLMGMFERVGNNGSGAVSFRKPGIPFPAASPACSENLATLAIRAQSLQQATTQGPSSVTPFSSGGTLGGVFPKMATYLPKAMRSAGTLALRELQLGGLPPTEHCPCIIKFSPSPDDESQGRVEYAFHTMARQAGLELPAACLIEDERGIGHFAVERFDRALRPDGTIQRHHLQSLSALLHRQAVGDIRYQDLMDTASLLGGLSASTEAFRRILFNLLSTNRDDHGRNHAFLYNTTSRQWQLAPAYDLNPSVSEGLRAIRWTSGSELPSRFEELLALAERYDIPRPSAIDIYQHVKEAVDQWHAFAKAAGVRPDIAKAWGEGILSEHKQGGPLRADARAFLSQSSQRKLRRP